MDCCLSLEKGFEAILWVENGMMVGDEDRRGCLTNITLKNLEENGPITILLCNSVQRFKV